MTYLLDELKNQSYCLVKSWCLILQSYKSKLIQTTAPSEAIWVWYWFIQTNGPNPCCFLGFYLVTLLLPYFFKVKFHSIKTNVDFKIIDLFGIQKGKWLNPWSPYITMLIFKVWHSFSLNCHFEHLSKLCLLLLFSFQLLDSAKFLFHLLDTYELQIGLWWHTDKRGFDVWRKLVLYYLLNIQLV